MLPINIDSNYFLNDVTGNVQGAHCRYSVTDSFRYALFVGKDPAFTIIGDTANWEITLEVVKREPPELLILDYLTLSGCTYKGLQQFSQKHSSVRIYIVTSD